MTTLASRRRREMFSPRNAGVVYAFVLLVGTFTALNLIAGRPFYLDGRNIANVLEQTSLVGILAVFMTIVLVSGNFDLSVGAAAAITGAAAVTTLDHFGIAGAIVIALLCGALIGLVNGVLVQLIGINSFIVTLGMLTMLRGLFLLLAEGRSVRATDQEAIAEFRSLVTSRWEVDNVLLIAGVVVVLIGVFVLIRAARSQGHVNVGGVVLVVAGVAGAIASFFLSDAVELAASAWYFLIITIVVWLVMSRTIFGRRVYAVGGNGEAARLAGISVNRYRIGAFILNGLAAGLVGAMYAARTGSVTPIALLNIELTVIAACILGGVALFGGAGSVLKSVIGALILFTLANGFNILNIAANSQKLIEGAIIIASAAIYTVSARRYERRGSGKSHVKVDSARAQPEATAATVPSGEPP